MSFEEYKQGIEDLNNKDNQEWIKKVTCWVKNELGYNIYIFQVVVNDEIELEQCYETIAASIATEFQINLEKTIEKWNIYLVFECLNQISEELKGKIEQDKYSSRKMVWDSLKEYEIGVKEYIEERLLYLRIDSREMKSSDESSLLDKIKNVDLDLYEAITSTNKDLNQQVALYLGGNSDEQKD